MVEAGPLNAGIAAAEQQDMTDRITTVDHGSANVFADLGVPEPESQFLKAQLVARLASVLRGRSLKSPAHGASSFGMFRLIDC